MKRIILVISIVASFVAAGLIFTQSVGAVDIYQPCDSAYNNSVVCAGKEESIDLFIKNIINLLLMAIAIVSVIMVIIGGFKYTTSNGDSNKVASAKNTIMYAVIGLAIAIFAYAIVNFVVDRINKSNGRNTDKAQTIIIDRRDDPEP